MVTKMVTTIMMIMMEIGSESPCGIIPRPFSKNCMIVQEMKCFLCYMDLSMLYMFYTVMAMYLYEHCTHVYILPPDSVSTE